MDPFCQISKIRTTESTEKNKDGSSERVVDCLQNVFRKGKAFDKFLSSVSLCNSILLTNPYLEPLSIYLP